MDASRWNQIEALFLDASAQPPAERGEFLDAACGVDTDLRAEVDSLLRADAEPPAVLEAALDDLATLLPDDDAGPLPDTTIGPYRLIRTLGEGGMGTVYLAVRDDVQKRVALKLVRDGLAAPDRRDRFLAERRILARLQHPHIASLLDAGVTDGGAPYLVMDVVEGLPLDRHCDEHQLGVDERLALFRTVCDAVAYAHRNLVVHRDLKPSNVLVGHGAEGMGHEAPSTSSPRPHAPSPSVKLLDFGIAKLLEDDDDLGLTRAGVRILSPRYASPEQVRGEPVTTASDVYSLGVVLYELLTGASPYDLAGTTLYEAEQQVLTSTPPRPSMRVLSDGTVPHPARRSRRLRGDLDAICLKALRKEPEHRYASAANLLADLDRQRAGLPVSARQDTVAYRVRSFVRRHRVGVAAAAALLLVLLAGLAGTAWQAREASRARDVAQQERDQARLEAEKAQATSAFLTDLFKQLDTNVTLGEPLTARELLDQGVARLDDLDDQPDVQAELLTAIGGVYMDLGLYGEARPLLERSLAIRQALYGGAHEATGQSQNQLGVLAWFDGDYARAEDFFERAVATHEAVYGTDDPRVGRYLRNLADARRARGDYARSERDFRRALALLRRAPDRDENTVLANTLNDFALLLRDAGRYAEAEPPIEEALALYRQRGENHPGVAQTEKNLGIVLADQGAFVRAERLLRDALGHRIAVYGADHPRVGQVLAPLAGVRYARGDAPEAERLSRQALAIFDAGLSPDHPDRAEAQLGLGRALTAQGQTRRARLHLEAALQRRESAFGPNDWRTAEARLGLGECLAALGRTREAEPLLRASLPILSERRGAVHPLTRDARRALASIRM